MFAGFVFLCLAFVDFSPLKFCMVSSSARSPMPFAIKVNNSVDRIG
jgi:hypothetical protein